MKRAEIIDKIIEDCDYTREEAEKLNNDKLFGAYLESEGIYGYGTELLLVIEAIYNIRLLRN